MKVYLVYINYNFEGLDILEGIYSTREKAEAALKHISKLNDAWVIEDNVK